MKPEDGSPTVGETVAGKYEVEAILGRGGMGVVFGARHLISGRSVALKWMLPDVSADPGALERFLREARAMGRIEHPNVVGVLDVGSENGAAYLVMERLRGKSLRALMDAEGPMRADRAVRLLLPAMEGVEAAHRAGVVHRDLKPENLFVVSGEGTTKVLDFGISKLRDDGPERRTSGSTLTRPGSVIGTPTYMSPEQVKSEPVDAHTDVWALATILYEMIAGRPPFVAETYSALMVAIATEACAPLTRWAPDAPVLLAQALHKALAKDPAARFADVASFATEIASYGGRDFQAPVTPSIAPPAPSSGGPQRREASTKEAAPTLVPLELATPGARARAATAETRPAKGPASQEESGADGRGASAAPARRGLWLGALAAAVAVVAGVVVVRQLAWPRASSDASPDVGAAAAVDGTGASRSGVAAPDGTGASRGGAAVPVPDGTGASRGGAAAPDGTSVSRSGAAAPDGTGAARSGAAPAVEVAPTRVVDAGVAGSVVAGPGATAHHGRHGAHAHDGAPATGEGAAVTATATAAGTETPPAHPAAAGRTGSLSREDF